MPSLRWEDAGDTGICFSAEVQGQPAAIAEFVRRCSLPLAVRRLRGQRQLMIVGVQSSFRHSRYLRAHRLTPLQIRRTAL